VAGAILLRALPFNWERSFVDGLVLFTSVSFLLFVRAIFTRAISMGPGFVFLFLFLGFFLFHSLFPRSGCSRGSNLDSGHAMSCDARRRWKEKSPPSNLPGASVHRGSSSSLHLGEIRVGFLQQL